MRPDIVTYQVTEQGRYKMKSVITGKGTGEI